MEGLKVCSAIEAVITFKDVLTASCREVEQPTVPRANDDVDVVIVESSEELVADTVQCRFDIFHVLCVMVVLQRS